jgi:hypothetical protein
LRKSQGRAWAENVLAEATGPTTACIASFECRSFHGGASTRATGSVTTAADQISPWPAPFSCVAAGDRAKVARQMLAFQEPSPCQKIGPKFKSFPIQRWQEIRFDDSSST